MESLSWGHVVRVLLGKILLWTMQPYIQIISKQIFSLCHTHFNAYLENPECIPSWFTTRLKERKEAPGGRFHPVCQCKLLAIQDFPLFLWGFYDFYCDLRRKVPRISSVSFFLLRVCVCASFLTVHWQCLLSKHTTVATFSGSKRF